MEELQELKDEYRNVKKHLSKYYWVKDVRDYIKLMRKLIDQKETELKTI